MHFRKLKCETRVVGRKNFPRDVGNRGTRIEGFQDHLLLPVMPLKEDTTGQRAIDQWGRGGPPEEESSGTHLSISKREEEPNLDRKGGRILDSGAPAGTHEARRPSCPFPCSPGKRL